MQLRVAGLVARILSELGVAVQVDGRLRDGQQHVLGRHASHEGPIQALGPLDERAGAHQGQAALLLANQLAGPLIQNEVQGNSPAVTCAARARVRSTLRLAAAPAVLPCLNWASASSR